MNWLDFVASIIGSMVALAWPAAVFGSVFLFRQELRTALPKLRLKHGETEISFKLDQAEQEVQQLPLEVTAEDLAPTPEEHQRFLRLAEISPRAAILDARTEIEQTAFNLLKQKGERNHSRGLLSTIRELRRLGMIDETASALLDNLRVIGNTAAHEDAEITSAEALRYAELANTALAVLNKKIELGEMGFA